MTKKKIIVSVTNDLTTDMRVDKICTTLLEMNYEVLLVGRVLPNSIRVRRKYATRRFKLWFNKGALFYANYNVRLFFFLLFNNFNALWSNDLDTLLSNFMISKIKGKHLVFDSHEYFTEVPELVSRPRVKEIWKRLEKRVLPKLKHVSTVSQSIADLYKTEYGIDVKLLRNVPALNNPIAEVENIKDEGKRIIIYQGAINVGRGVAEMVEAMQYVENSVLYVFGKGDISNQVEELVGKLGLTDKVKLMGEIQFGELSGYTIQADLGLSLEEDMGLNYRFALPNKLFNYIHSGLPVLVADLPEMKNLVQHYQVGEVIESHNPKHIADKINMMLNDQQKMNMWSENAKKAAKELNWENEKHVIKELLNA